MMHPQCMCARVEQRQCAWRLHTRIALPARGCPACRARTAVPPQPHQSSAPGPRAGTSRWAGARQTAHVEGNQWEVTHTRTRIYRSQGRTCAHTATQAQCWAGRGTPPACLVLAVHALGKHVCQVSQEVVEAGCVLQHAHADSSQRPMPLILQRHSLRERQRALRAARPAVNTHSCAPVQDALSAVCCALMHLRMHVCMLLPGGSLVVCRSRSCAGPCRPVRMQVQYALLASRMGLSA